MKRLSLALLAALAGAAACDSPTGGPDVARVIVSPSNPNINVGQTVQLSAEARDEENLALEGVGIDWSTLDPGIATVSAAGLVTGVAGGTARIVAEAGGAADTARVGVFAVAAACNSPGAAPTLAVGQSVTVQGAAASTLCLSGQTSGAEYVVVPFWGTTETTVTIPLQATPIGVSAVTGPPLPSLASFTGSSGAARRGDGGFHTRLNERARPYLSRLVPAARSAYQRRGLQPRLQMQQSAPTVGTLLRLNVGLEFCDQPDYRTGRIMAISNRAVVVSDTANPAGGLTQADFDHVAATFDTLIYPVNTAAFGEPLDVDQNGRVTIFYTRAVNELTPANAGYVVGGFFYGRDLFPHEDDGRFPACAGSNVSEMFYLLAADPAGAVNGNARSAAYVRGSTLAVVGHEFQHLISASRRLYVVPGVGGLDWSEEAFLNEGLSHIAEELLFYHRAQRQPRQNIGAEVLQTGQPGRNAFIEFQEDNYERFALYLENPDQDSPYDVSGGETDDLATRGAAWGFLRYAADRRAGDDNALWYDLVNSNLTGLDNLEAELGQDPIPLFRDFAVSLYTDDAGPPVPAILTQPSWNHRSLYQAIDGAYPLEVRQLVSGTPVSYVLAAGGAAYMRAAVAAGQRASIGITAGGTTPAGTVSVTIVRTK